MAYKLLGILVWKFVKWSLRRKVDGGVAPKTVLAGGALLVIAGVLLAGARQRGGED
jgi:UPF0716 family protein affecting phage T7 exclusion